MAQQALNGPRWQRWLARLWLIAAGMLMLLPFWYLLVFASHDSGSIFNLPPPMLPGRQFANNIATLSATPFWAALGNSLYVTCVGTVLALAVSALTGFALAVYRFTGRRLLMALALLAMLLPPFMTVLPYFFWVNQLGWVDQFRAAYMPAAVSGMGVLLMRQHIAQGIPQALLDAARIDGCNEWQLFVRIALPLCKPALATLAVICFIAAWNSFLLPLVVLPSPEHYTVHVALRAMQGASGGDWGGVMAGALLAIVPTLIVLALATRQWRSVLAGNNAHEH